MKCPHCGQDVDDSLKPLINVNQLLALLPISRRKLADDIKAGKIPCVKLGDRLLFDWETVRACLIRGW